MIGHKDPKDFQRVKISMATNFDETLVHCLLVAVLLFLVHVHPFVLKVPLNTYCLRCTF